MLRKFSFSVCQKRPAKPMPITIILRKQELTLEDKSIQVKLALEKLGLSSESYLVVRNGELVNENETLREGDIIRLVAAISGGCR